MVLIENEGALFRGHSRAWPTEVWSPKQGWQPYAGETPKPVEWGEEISEAEAEALKAERHAAFARVAEEMA